MRSFALTVLTLVLLAAAPATAQENPPSPPGGGLGNGDGDSGGDDGEPVVQLDGSVLSFEVGRTSQLVLTESRGGSGLIVRCGFYDWTGGVESWTVPVTPFERDFAWVLHCWYPTDDLADTWTAGVPGYPQPYVCCGDPTPTDFFVDEDEVAQFAADSIDFGVPVPELSPSTQQVVGVPTWLAVTSNLDFAPVSAAADSVWVTVRPEFAGVTWEFGNGDPPVTCVEDAATTWDPRLGDEQETQCVHTFSGNGDGEPLPGRVTVTWNIWMESHRTTPAEELWGVVSTPFDMVFDVRELQAVID